MNSNKIFLAGLGAVALLVAAYLGLSRGQHLALEGKILKVRVLPQSASSASVVLVDFRVFNPADVPFTVDKISVDIETADGTSSGDGVSKSDAALLLEYAKQLGPAYSPVFSSGDEIKPKQSMDRMMIARVEIPESAVHARRKMVLKVFDTSGAVAEISEAAGPRTTE